MLKLTGAIIVIGTSTLIGLIMAERLNERSRLLRVLIRLLNVIKTEIGYHSGLLADVFNRAAEVINHPNLELSLKRIAQNIGFGSDFNLTELWDGFLKGKEMADLSKDDLAILKELGAYLGSTDREDQITRIVAASTRLESNLEMADLDIARRAKLYRYFGFAAGAVLVCFLL